jgi:hypothetical protein
MASDRIMSDWRDDVTKTIRARYSQGKLEPLEPLELAEGSEILVSVTAPEAIPVTDPTGATAGGWRELLDCEMFEEDVYANRLLQTRPRVEL